MNIFSKLFGQKKRASQESNQLENRSVNQDKSRTQKPRDIDFNSIEYIPLPPSPKTWEVDGRDEFHVEFSKPDLKEVFIAGWQKKYTKVIKLSKNLSSTSREGRVGEVIAKAYRDVIIKRRKAQQLLPAARWASEMLGSVPVHCTDTDRRRFNAIIKQLNKEHITHEYDLLPLPRSSDVPLFQVLGNESWEITNLIKLDKVDRPDTAYKPIAITGNGVLFADSSGKSEVGKDGKAALVKYGFEGVKLAEKALHHDIYRYGCGPETNCCAIMDSFGKLWVYGALLEPMFSIGLKEDIRVVEHFRTVDTNYWGEFKSQVRAVDVNASGQFYLFTIADEAWCCSQSGITKWGIRLPLKEGWTRVVGRSAKSGPSVEIERALSVFDLSLPVTTDIIKSRYRSLALQYHPDRNPGNEQAKLKMQEVNNAFELVTGIDPSTLDVNVSESEMTYFHKEPSSSFSVGPIKLEITLIGGNPQDWVYGASFDSTGEGAFLASYSGKVVRIDNTGLPLRIYDLGSIAEEITEAGEYLYLKTLTRLYVIKNSREVVALLDVYKKGMLLVSDSGFGLVSDKSFKWFSQSGKLQGEVLAKHPIRAIYSCASGAVIETRQNRAVISGLELLSSIEHGE